MASSSPLRSVPNDTKGIDWTDLLVQVILAAVGVAAIGAFYGRRRA